MKVSDILKEGWSPAFGDGKDTQEMTRIMRIQGYELLGSGADKAAFMNSKNEVIMLVAPGTARANAIEWFKYCQRNEGNPHLPTVIDFADFAFKTAAGRKATYLQVKIEKLFELSESKNTMLGFALESTADFADYAYGDRSQRIEEVKRQIERRIGDDKKFQFMVSLIDDIEYFIGTLIDIIDYGARGNLSLDLHDGNFMLGSDGNLVITDPWV